MGRGSRAVPVWKQAQELRERRGFICLLTPAGNLIAQGRIGALDVNADYLIEIRYRLNYNPLVYMIDPPVRTRNGKRPEHMYSDGALCVYVPSNGQWPGEWTPDMLLADTIVPWAMLWLLHYEIWFITGNWTGGGHHGHHLESARLALEEEKKQRQKRRRRR